jgi:hypothetical protein
MSTKKGCVVCVAMLVSIASTAVAQTSGFSIGDTIIQGDCQIDHVQVDPIVAEAGAVIKVSFLDFSVETDASGGRQTATCNLGIEVLHRCGGCVRVHSATWDGTAEVAEGARGRASAAYYINANEHERVSQTFYGEFWDDFTLTAEELNEYIWDGRPLLLNADARLYVRGPDSYIMLDTASSEVEWHVSCC